MNLSVIELERISHRFSMHWALAEVGLCVKEGEAVAVLGPNGCGKSTILKIVATLMEPTKGEGNILGFDLKRDVFKIREKVEWLGHELGLYKALTAEENLKFSSVIRGRKPSIKDIQEAIFSVGLNGSAKKQVASFSSGMRKRLSLAKILLQSPSILLLDEPHANLDKEGKTMMNGFISRWKKGGTTLLLASHDHQEVLPLCDKALVLNQGKVVYFGSPKEIPKSIIL